MGFLGSRKRRVPDPDEEIFVALITISGLLPKPNLTGFTFQPQWVMQNYPIRSATGSPTQLVVLHLLLSFILYLASVHALHPLLLFYVFCFAARWVKAWTYMEDESSW